LAPQGESCYPARRTRAGASGSKTHETRATRGYQHPAIWALEASGISTASLTLPRRAGSTALPCSVASPIFEQSARSIHGSSDVLRVDGRGGVHRRRHHQGGTFEAASEHASRRRALLVLRRILQHPLDGGSRLGGRLLKLPSRLHRARAHGCERWAYPAVQSAARSRRCLDGAIGGRLGSAPSRRRSLLTKPHRSVQGRRRKQR
jgi:hypothetical protein